MLIQYGVVLVLLAFRCRMLEPVKFELQLWQVHERLFLKLFGLEHGHHIFVFEVANEALKVTSANVDPIPRVYIAQSQDSLAE